MKLATRTARHETHRHIVVVDDRPEVGAIVRLGLEELGHFRVSAVGSGDEALPLFDADRPDLVLLDAVLPGISGIELALHAVKRNIPVLMMTGEGAMQERLARAGWPHLRKPFHLKQLSAEVQSTMKQRRENLRAIRASLDRLFQSTGDLQQLLDRLIELRRRTEETLARARRLGDRHDRP
ncbi:MAG TPA: response regulator [Stellaceae bacterium]|nr:response regulator [Stellaceae bacterium]